MSGLTAAEVLNLLSEYGECWCERADRERGVFKSGCPKHEAAHSASKADRSGDRQIAPAAVPAAALRGYLGCGKDTARVVIAIVLWRAITSTLRRREALEPAEGQTFTEAAEEFVRASAHTLQITPGSALETSRESTEAQYLAKEVELLGLTSHVHRIMTDERAAR